MCSLHMQHEAVDAASVVVTLAYSSTSAHLPPAACFLVCVLSLHRALKPMMRLQHGKRDKGGSEGHPGNITVMCRMPAYMLVVLLLLLLFRDPLGGWGGGVC
jgi:hypothetical protein